ncbi:helix-turn-helix domain-containing protein [Haloferax sp. DFSO60]|uniref:helix-turn-helix domain-containing protein n=1 Tax=Haloferax sp. DFSO60 TaxID=3388652 RepID=UPI003979EF21
MSLIAEVEVPISVLCLGRVSNIDHVELELEPVIPIADTHVRFVWVWGEDATEFGSHAERLPELTETTMLETVPDGALYQIVWEPPSSSLLAALSEFDVTLLACTSNSDTWKLRLRFRSHTALRNFRAYCVTEQIDLETTHLVSLEEHEEPLDNQLTPSQREALLLALERGYFDDHRRTSLAELGTELDISRQAVAARLRRAFRSLASTVSEETPRDERIT